MAFKFSNFWKLSQKNVAKAIAERDAAEPDLPENIVDLIKCEARNTIVFDVSPNEGQPLAPGASKLGGVPDLPPDFEWYQTDGPTWEGKTNERYYAFYAQINLCDAREYDTEKLLPEEGILYFFFDYDGVYYGEVAEKLSMAKVFYYDGPFEKLKPSIPSNYPQHYKLTEMPLSFKSEVNYPQYEDLAITKTWKAKYANRKAYKKVLREIGYTLPDTASKLLGYSGWAHYSVEMGSYCAANGYKYLEAIQNEKKMKAAIQGRDDYLLLFQLDTATIEKTGTDMQFADMGKIYFCISRNALKIKDFTRIYFDMQG